MLRVPQMCLCLYYAESFYWEIRSQRYFLSRSFWKSWSHPTFQRVTLNWGNKTLWMRGNKWRNDTSTLDNIKKRKKIWLSNHETLWRKSKIYNDWFRFWSFRKEAFVKIDQKLTNINKKIIIERRRFLFFNF